MSKYPLIVGLGNPGIQYEHTRHNVGFLILDRLALAAGVSFQSKPRWEGHVAKLPDGTLLLKPQTFMNESGRSVQRVASFFKLTPEQILIVYDDLALPLGRLRFRPKGSDGGHNGIRSLIAHLGTQSFPRLRVGIGGAPQGNMVGYVLGNFHPEEQELLQDTLVRSVQGLIYALNAGVEAAANRFNPDPKPPKSETKQSEEEKPDEDTGHADAEEQRDEQ